MKRTKLSDSGFSLLELVVVLAIFALMATMSVQALQGTLRSQQKLQTRSEVNTELTLALARLRLDLESAVPLTFRDIGGTDHPALVIDQRSGQMALSIGGQARFAEEPSAGFGRIEWYLNEQSGQIMRRYWPSLNPARPESEIVEVPVMDGVQALEIWTFSLGTGWVTGWPVPEDVASLPLAIRILIETKSLGQIELVERL